MLACMPQFHKEGDKVVSEYILGMYSPEASALDDIASDDSAGAVSAAKYVMQVSAAAPSPAAVWRLRPLSPLTICDGLHAQWKGMQRPFLVMPLCLVRYCNH